MSVPISSRRCTSRSLSLRTALLSLVLAASFLSGCITQKQVQNIITESNFQMLTVNAELASTQLQANPLEASEPADALLGQIATFIAQHPDKPSLTTPLRLRQAILYLNKKSYAAADAAFEAITPSNLHTERDLALYGLRKDFSWWYEHSETTSTSFVRDQEEKAQQVMAKFASAAGKLKESPEVRDHLLEARAWISLHLAGGLDGSARAQAIKEALDGLSPSMSATEEELIAQGSIKKNTPAFSRSTRFALRIDTLVRKASDLAKGLPAEQRPILANETLQTALRKRIQ
jgi:hypothetical protein